MKEIVDFLLTVRVTELAADPRVVAAAAVLFALAVWFRWKAVLLLLFAAGAMLTVVRYARVEEASSPLDPGMVLFAVGTLAVAAVLIYFLFVRGD